MRPVRALSALALLLATGSCPAAEPPVAFEQRPAALLVTVGGKRLADYVYEGGSVPRAYFTNVLSPAGVQVTRNHPPRKGDAADHPHHVGIFLAFGDINGVDYWHPKGRVIHDGVLAPPAGGPGMGTFAMRYRYLAPAGKATVLSEECRHTVRADAEGWWIEYDSTLTAAADTVKIGSKEEGGVAVRVATPLAASSGQGGRLLDSAGRVGGDAIWGKQAAWVDYAGPVQGKHAGVLIVPHPDNPCWWHARDYGLVGANPFGPLNTGPGRTLKKGDTLRLRYGVLVHSHDAATDFDPARAARAYLRRVSKP